MDNPLNTYFRYVLLFLGTALLLGAAPVREGVEVGVVAGGGHYENSACGVARQHRVRSAQVQVAYAQEDGFVARAAGGYLDDEELAALAYKERDETVDEYHRRVYEDGHPAVRSDLWQRGAGLVRLGYQGRWGGVEAGPFVDEGVLFSALARFNPIDELYIYASVLDQAMPREHDFFGIGAGWQSERFRLDVAPRLGLGLGGLRVQSSYRVTERLWVGGSSYLLNVGLLYPEWNAFGQVSYQFDADDFAAADSNEAPPRPSPDPLQRSGDPQTPE